MTMSISPSGLAPMGESLFQTAPPVTTRPRWQSLSRRREDEDGEGADAMNAAPTQERGRAIQRVESGGRPHLGEA